MAILMCTSSFSGIGTSQRTGRVETPQIVVLFVSPMFAHVALVDFYSLKALSEIHSLNLRSSENGLLHIPLSRTTIFDNSFTCSAPKLWNALPQTVRASGSLVTFKKNLKHCFNS